MSIRLYGWLLAHGSGDGGGLGGEEAALSRVIIGMILAAATQVHRT